MTFHMLWVIALGLSMDAFAVSISKGLAMRAFRWKQALAIACCFGLFQGIMPAIGYVVGLQFSQMIQNWDHWIAFVLLALIGVNMIREGLSSNDEPAPSLISLKHLLTLGVATSIDALAVGVSFAFLKERSFFRKKFKSKAEIFGGLVLLVMAVKILHEHGVF